MKVVLLTVFILFSAYHCLAQDKDSLQAVNYYKLGREQTYNNPTLARKNIHKSISLAKRTDNRLLHAKALNTLGLCQRNLSEYDSAIATFSRASAIFSELKELTGHGNAVNNLAMTYYYLGEYERSNTMLLDIINEAEANKIHPVLAITYQNIGLINNAQERYRDALSNFEKAEFYHELAGNVKGKTGAANNRAYIYFKNLKQYDKALSVYKEVIPVKKTYNDDVGIAICYNNITEIYLAKKDLVAAQKNISKAININERLQNKHGLGVSYLLAARLAREKEQYSVAADYAGRSAALAKETGARNEESEALKLLAEIQARNNDALQAYETLARSTQIKDSLLNRENFARMAELETKYETEKKERHILEQRNKIAEHQQHIARQNRVIYIILLFALMAILLAYIIYNRQRIKTIRLEQEAQLAEIKRQVETQNKLQEQRTLISRDLHDNIGAQLTFIISSLDNLKYGFELPDALKDRLQYIRNFTKDTITELRDTIWAMNKETISVGDLKTRISNFIETARSLTADTQFVFETDPKLSDAVAFSAVKGINMYRIIQESLHNALKYSGENAITVEMRSDDGLLITVSDNGHGFNVANATGGNGLSNIAKRTAENGGTLDIASNENGTIITARFDKNTASGL